MELPLTHRGIYTHTHMDILMGQTLNTATELGGSVVTCQGSSVLYPFKCLASSKEAVCTILKVFGRTLPGFEPPTSQIQSIRSNNYMTESAFTPPRPEATTKTSIQSLFYFILHLCSSQCLYSQMFVCDRGSLVFAQASTLMSQCVNEDAGQYKLQG